MRQRSFPSRVRHAQWRLLLAPIVIAGVAIGPAGASQPLAPIEVQVRTIEVRPGAAGAGAALTASARVEVSLQAGVPVGRIRLVVRDLLPTNGGEWTELGRFEPALIEWTMPGSSPVRSANGWLSLAAGETVRTVLEMPLKGAAFRYLALEVQAEDPNGSPVRGGDTLRLGLGVPPPGPFSQDDTVIEYRAVPSKEVPR